MTTAIYITYAIIIASCVYLFCAGLGLEMTEVYEEQYP